MDTVVAFLVGGGGGALILFILGGWISERLRQSIQHEYSQKLATSLSRKRMLLKADEALESGKPVESTVPICLGKLVPP